jgi:hypothetical protein
MRWMLTLEPHIAVGRIAADGALSITLSGAWTLRSGFPSAGPIAREIATRRPRSVVFDVRDLGAWDSALVTFPPYVDRPELVSRVGTNDLCPSPSSRGAVPVTRSRR